MDPRTENFADRATPNPSGTIDALAMQGYLALVRAREAPKTVLGEASQSSPLFETPESQSADDLEPPDGGPSFRL